MSKVIVMMAGGTGGHIFPGLAIAQMFSSQGWQVVWFGNSDAMESRLVAKAELMHFYNVGFRGFQGKRRWLKLGAMFKLVWAVLRCQVQLMRLRPKLVFGLGGYVSVPGALAAISLRFSLVIHEQNALAGRANRHLAKFAALRLTGFPDVLAQAHWVGNPVAFEVPKFQARPLQATRPLRIFVLGGSLGASVFNAQLPDMLARVAAVRSIEVRHQSGRLGYESVVKRYQTFDFPSQVLAFVEEMPKLYAWADVVVARAGAMTVSELAAMGVASVLVPFPHALDDHQYHNACVLKERSAAKVIRQCEDWPNRLEDFLRQVSFLTLAKMAQQANTLARQGVADAIFKISTLQC